jgi:hypothetical protein
VFPIEVAERSLASCVAYPTTLDRSVINPMLCAGGIASDFLSDPSKAPDLACAQADDYKTNFVLK